MKPTFFKGAAVGGIMGAFVAGATMALAATGGNFILGASNSANKTTALSVSSLPDASTCPAPCEALKVSDSSTASNAGGLGVVGKSASTPAATIQNTGGGIGVQGVHAAGTGSSAGVLGDTNSTASGASGVFGRMNSSSAAADSAAVRGV